MPRKATKQKGVTPEPAEATPPLSPKDSKKVGKEEAVKALQEALSEGDWDKVEETISLLGAKPARPKKSPAKKKMTEKRERDTREPYKPLEVVCDGCNRPFKARPGTVAGTAAHKADSRPRILCNACQVGGRRRG